MPAMSEETKAALGTLPEAAQKELQGFEIVFPETALWHVNHSNRTIVSTT